jgi:hypothetical protein
MIIMIDINNFLDNVYPFIFLFVLGLSFIFSALFHANYFKKNKFGVDEK